MNLEEIIRIPKQSQHNIKDMSVFNNVVQYKKVQVEKYPLLYREESGIDYFCIADNGTKFAYIIAQKNTYENKNCLIIRRTWVETVYRNKGYMKAMYNTLHNCGFVVLSDIELSPESISIWRALAISRNVKIIDIRTEELRAPKDSDYYTTNTNTRFILEKIHNGAIEDMSGILQEYQYFINNRYKEIL